MARLNIDTGAVGNPSTGDSLRTAMTKINTNFTEVYSLVRDGSSGLIATDVTNGDLKLQANGTGAIEIDTLSITNSTITSITTNSDITLTPNGTGNVVLGNFTLNADQTVGAGQDNYVMTYDHSTQTIGLEASAGGASGITFTGDDSTGTLISDGETVKIAGGTGITTAMSGDTLTITASAGSGLQSRATKAGTTASLANAAEGDLDITGFKGYALFQIQTDRAARVRVYTDAASRTADASRGEGVDPAADDGVIAEVITTGAQTILISPGAIGFNNEGTPTTTIPCRVTNKSGGTSTVVVTLHVLQLEA